MPIYRRVFLSLLRIVAGVPIISALLVGLLVLIFSVTWRGRSVGLSIVLWTGLLYCCVGYWNRAWFVAVRRRLVILTILPAILCYAVPLWLAMRGVDRDQRVRSCFLESQSGLSLFSPVQTIPEVDQLNVAMTLLPLRDPHVDFAKSRRMKSLIVPVYRELARDNGFAHLGTALGFAYREVFRLDFQKGHYYLFLPPTAPGEKLPCLVFLHGLGGNTKSRLWVLSRISEQLKCALVAPSFGIGNWDQDGGTELVIKTTHEVIEQCPVDAERVYLMGYSNGAMGVTRAAVADPALFKGLIYLSPVTEDQLFSTAEFRQRRDDRAMLFLHGGQDSRIPRNLVEGTVGALRRSGYHVQLKMYEDDDHFLLMARPDEVIDDIVEFLQTH